MGLAVTGWMLGTGKTGQMLAFQIVMNGTNAGLDAWFVAGLDWGPTGIGAGTAIAEWVALIFGLILVAPMPACWTGTSSPRRLRPIATS